MLILISFLLASTSWAETFTTCSAFYSVGIGHTLKGEALTFNDQEKLPVGQAISDGMYELTTAYQGNTFTKKLINVKSGEEVPFYTVNEAENFGIYSTQALKDSPEGVPGYSSRMGVYFMLLCADSI